MRLIDADTLMPLFVKKANTMKDRHGVKLGDEWLLSYNDIEGVIASAPAIITARTTTEGFPIIDMRPRNTGSWNYIQAGMAVCPFCGAVPHKLYKDYCAKCGADMRGGRE